MDRRGIMSTARLLDFIIMTSTSNPAAMAVMKSKGYAASSTEMWLSEALNVTSFTGFTSNTSITNFEEFRYFQNCTTVEGRAFKGASNLTKVVLPQSITDLSYETFNGCSNLTELTIPPNVTTVQATYYIAGCDLLKKLIILSPANIAWTQNLASIVETVIFGPLVTKMNGRLFKGFTNIRSILFTSNLTEILYEVFSNFDFLYLQTFDVPATVTTIGDNVFVGCTNLTNLILRNPDPSNYKANIFGSSGSYPVNIYVPDEAVNTYKAKAWGNSDIKNRIKPISLFSN